MAPMKVFSAIIFSSFLFEAAADDCITFGKNGLAEVDGCQSVSDLVSMPKTVGFNGDATWAVELDSGLAVLIGDTVQLWSGGSDFTEIGLGGFTTPVGAVHLDGKLYVACFGSWPNPLGDSGLAVIDVAGRSLESTHIFGDSTMHVHNVYAFDYRGKKEIFAAILGNPWAKGQDGGNSPLAGKGLSRFDRTTRSFDLDTSTDRLNVRSAKQQSDGSIFVLTQEPAGEQTKFARLVEADGQLSVEAQTLLPPRTSGDGGADVVLGFEKDTIWVTDREDWGGKLYFYTYSNGQLIMQNVRGTDANPRYTVALDNGDIVVCDQNSADLSVYKGLASSPMDESIQEHRVPTLDGPMFFMKTSVLDSSSWPSAVIV